MPPINRMSFATSGKTALFGSGFVAVILATMMTANADTFADALAHAYLYNTDLAAARAHLRGVDEQVPQALAGWRPTVTLSTGNGGYTTFNTGTSNLLPTGFGYQQFAYGGNLQLKQPLYSGGGTVADVARAEATVRAARADLLGTEQTVLQQAATAYDDVLRSRALLALDREIERLLNQQVKEITLRMQAGQLTLTDVDQAASRQASAKATRIGAEGDLLAATARFVAAVGRQPGGEMKMHGPLPGMPKDAAEAIKLADINSPTVVASLFRMNAAEQAKAVAQAALLPSVSLSAQAGADQGESIPTVSTKQLSLTVNVTVPVYQGGALSSQVRQAAANASESKLQTLNSRRDARKNAEVAYATWRAGADQLEQQDKVQLPLAEAAYDNVRKEAAVGAKSTFELLGQLQDLFNSRISEVQARYDVASSTYQLLVAVGRFTAADLKLQVPLYDATANYNKVRNKGSLVP